MKSPRWLSSSSPTGVSSDTGSCEMRWISRTRLGRHAPPCRPAPRRSAHARAPAASGAARACTLLIVSTMCTGNADRAGLVGDGPGDGLADPPRGVGGELEALRVVELLDRPHQAEVALLDQVEEQHPPADVALGDRHDQAQVGLGQLLLGLSPSRGQRLERMRSVSGTRGRRRASSRRRIRVLDRLRPASIRLARLTSWPPVSSGTLPISFRYMRTGSDEVPLDSSARRTRRLPAAADSTGRGGRRCFQAGVRRLDDDVRDKASSSSGRRLDRSPHRSDALRARRPRMPSMKSSS